MKLLVLYFVLGLSLASALPHQSGYHQTSDELLEEFVFPEDRSTKVHGENLNDFKKYIHNIFSSIKNLREQGISKIRQLLKRETGTSTETGSASGNYSSLISLDYYRDICKKLLDCLQSDDYTDEKFKDLVEKLLPFDKYFRKHWLDLLKNEGVYILEYYLRGCVGAGSDIFKRSRTKSMLRSGKQIKKLFGKGSELGEQLVDLLKTKGEQGKNKILELIDRILGEKEKKRSIKDIYDKIKDYFKDIHIELKDKFLKFGEYAKELLAKEHIAYSSSIHRMVLVLPRVLR